MILFGGKKRKMIIKKRKYPILEVYFLILIAIIEIWFLIKYNFTAIEERDYFLSNPTSTGCHMSVAVNWLGIAAIFFTLKITGFILSLRVITSKKYTFPILIFCVDVGLLITSIVGFFYFVGPGDPQIWLEKCIGKSQLPFSWLIGLMGIGCVLGCILMGSIVIKIYTDRNKKSETRIAEMK